MQETEVIVVGDYNEDVYSKIIQEFMVEMGLHDKFSEVNDVDEKTKMERSNIGQSA